MPRVPANLARLGRLKLFLLFSIGESGSWPGEPRPDVPNLPGKTFLGKNEEKVSRFRSVFELCVAAWVSLERLIGDVGMPFAWLTGCGTRFEKLTTDRRLVMSKDRSEQKSAQGGKQGNQQGGQQGNQQGSQQGNQKDQQNRQGMPAGRKDDRG